MGPRKSPVNQPPWASHQVGILTTGRDFLAHGVRVSQVVELGPLLTACMFVPRLELATVTLPPLTFRSERSPSRGRLSGFAEFSLGAQRSGLCY